MLSRVWPINMWFSCCCEISLARVFLSKVVEKHRCAVTRVCSLRHFLGRAWEHWGSNFFKNVLGAISSSLSQNLTKGEVEIGGSKGIRFWRF